MDVAIELSNFQLLGMETFRPCVSVVCNIAPDHLDYMDSLEAYYQSKMRIYQKDPARRTTGSCAMSTIRSSCSMRRIFPAVSSITRSHAQTSICIARMARSGSAIRCSLTPSTLKIVGDYNVANAMAAACMAYRMGVSLEDIQSGLRIVHFCGAPVGIHR